MPSLDCIFIDESGDAGLHNSRVAFYTVGYVYSSNPIFLRKLLVRYLIRSQSGNTYPQSMKELKFFLQRNKLKEDGYSQSEIASFLDNLKHIRMDVLNILERYSSGVFVAILDKNSRRFQTWTPETITNYVIGHTLMYNIIRILPILSNPTICYDQGRLAIHQTEDFERYLNFKYGKYNFDTQFGKPLSCNRLDSISEPIIWAADILAGAYYYQYSRNDSMYTRTISNKIGMGWRRYWDI